MLFGEKAVSQNSLWGVITDKESSDTLIGASIYFPDLKKGSTTNQNGLFELTDLPKGSFLVEVRFIGYSIQAVKVDINGRTRMDFELEPTHKELNEVVITGTSAATQKAINPVQTTTINRVSLNQTSSTNIIDAISNQPGISQVTTGVSISKPVIRGLGYNRVIVLQNNVRQEGQQWGDEHGIEIDEFSIDKVEIIKGPGSLMYGSDAMAGAINLLPPNPVDKGRVTLNFLTSHHSNNNQQGYSLYNAGNLKGINWYLQGTRKVAGNYSNSNDGRVYNSGFDELNLNGSVGISKKLGYSQINFSTFNQNLALVRGERDSLGNFTKPVVVGDSVLIDTRVTDSDLSGYEIGIPRQSIRHHRISTSNKVILGKSRLALTFGFQQNERKEFEYHEEDGKIGEEAGLHLILNTINVDVAYHLPDLRGWETSLGINGFQQTSANRGEDFLIPEYSLIDAGIFAITRRTFDKLHLSGGLRYNTRTIDTHGLFLDADGKPVTGSDPNAALKFAAFNNTFSALAYSLGASYRFEKKVIGKLNLSSGFRAPNIDELGANGAHHGSLRYRRGNPELRPETSLQLDAGFLFNTKHISLEIGAFRNAIDDYIFSHKLYNSSGGDSVFVDASGDVFRRQR